jgi:hypothetical protein
MPVLLQPDALAMLLTMGRKAAASLQEEFGLPLGLIIIDTVVASAGYVIPGAENDSGINQRLMIVLRLASHQLNCFVLGIDHFGKDIGAGTRSASSTEASSDALSGATPAGCWGLLVLSSGASQPGGYSP